MFGMSLLSDKTNPVQKDYPGPGYQLLMPPSPNCIFSSGLRQQAIPSVKTGEIRRYRYQHSQAAAPPGLYRQAAAADPHDQYLYLPYHATAVHTYQAKH